MKRNMHDKYTPTNWPPDGLERVLACPICGCRERELLYADLVDRVFFCAPGKWTLHTCSECGTGFLDPRPNLETIHLAYENYYTHDVTPEISTLRFSSRLRRRFANGYRNARYGTREYPANRFGYFLGNCLPYLGAAADATMRHLPKPSPGSRLLDVGCGNGLFLARAKSAGWEVRGIDPDVNAVKAAREQGLDVDTSHLSTLDNEEKFDVITLSHVIEHVHDPMDTLRTCFALLNPSGFLWIETPNIESEGHKEFGRNWRGLEVPRHLALFTQSSLAHALREAGFRTFEAMPYRDQCKYMHSASEAIRQQLDPYRADLTKILHSARITRKIKDANRKARRNPQSREFLTVKAYKLANEPIRP